MKFAIVSDTHDNLKNFGKAIDFCNKKKIGLILHCGDICSRETISEAAKKFNGEIKFVRGNADYNLDELREKMEIQLGNKRIFFNHYPDIARKAAKSGDHDFVFYGHTHAPKLEKIPACIAFSEADAGRGKCLLANPGELAGQINKPSFAVCDTETGKLELKILEKLA